MQNENDKKMIKLGEAVVTFFEAFMDIFARSSSNVAPTIKLTESVEVKVPEETKQEVKEDDTKVERKTVTWGDPLLPTKLSERGSYRNQKPVDPIYVLSFMKEHYYEKIPFWCFSAEDEHILKDILRELKRVFDVTLTTTYASSLYASLGMTVDYKNAFILYRPSESNGENKCIGALIKVGNKYKVGAMPGDEFLDALEQKDTAEEEVPPKKKKPSKAPDTTPEEDKEEEVEEHKEAEEIKKKRHRRTKAELAAALEATAKEQEDSKKTVEEPKKRKKPAPFKSTPEDIDTQTKAIENKMKGIKEVKEPIADESSKRTRKVKTEAPAKEPVRSDVKGSKSGKTRK